MNQKSSNFLTSVKIVSVLLAICIVCGVLLALCNDLLYIDDETKFNRAMQKVYPDFKRDTSFSETPVAGAKTLAGVGEVSKVYRSTDGTYVVESIGYGGFSSGTVTMYVAIGGTTPNVKIKALGITANVGQSWVAKVDQKSLNNAYVGKNIQDVSAITFGGNYKIGGTTYTSTAVLNSVKAAANYCITGLKLVSTPESEARDAAKDLLGNYNYTTITDETYKTALGYDFYFTAVNEGESYDVYVFGNADDGHQIVAINNTLTHNERTTSDDAIKVKTDGISDETLAKVRGLSHIESQVQQLRIEGFTYDIADDHGGEFATNEAYGTARIANVYRSNSGAMAIIATCDPGSYNGYSPKTLTLMVVISADKIVNWKVVSVGGHTYYNSSFDEFYKDVDINDTIEYQKVTGATGTSDAIYNIIGLCANYAREINK